jgi:hypothetical protein
MTFKHIYISLLTIQIIWDKLNNCKEDAKQKTPPEQLLSSSEASIIFSKY